MGGFFGTVAKATSCVADLFYGTDYNSHLGTKRGGLATYDAETAQFTRSIHNLESTYFRTKFEDELDKFKGNSGIGIISDTDPQPLILNSHLGRFAIVTVAKIVNLQELEAELLLRTCTSPNSVRAKPIRRNLLPSLSYKEKHLSKELKMCISISKVPAPCCC